MADQGRLLKQVAVPATGLYVAPTVIKLDGIEQLQEEIFGPVLHVASFEARQLDTIVDTVNARGYGLTFGLHTRVDSRVEQVVKRIKTGNIYVNRNQIGAVVGTQPFGGEGLSGTGPKAGGPYYLKRFRSFANVQAEAERADMLEPGSVQAAIRQCLELPEQVNPLAFEHAVEHMPGPTGESNQLSTHPRGLVLCLGPGRALALQQANAALSVGNRVVAIAADELPELQGSALPVVTLRGLLKASDLLELNGFDAVLYQAVDITAREYRQVLSDRQGALIPLIDEIQAERLVIERHLCIDTTAAGGNASLIAASS
ncbi:MAG: aldehyde dehydrogenase family protein [Gammaproteobacteria bacterium]|nr:aldehyde dehydrogenase family protein [Gammaproteobacteria bacterium]